MSGTEALGEEGVVAEDGPIEGEATEAVPGDEHEAAPEASDYEYLELDEGLTDKYVRLTIEGEEVPVKLSDALSGYNREAVSTRRFQEAAALKDQAEYGLRLQQALEANPQMTLKILQEQIGGTQSPEVPAEPEVEYADPLERQLAEERQARQALEDRISAREADETLSRAVDGLKQAYGADDTMVREVVTEALRMQVGPEAFPTIYRALAFEKLQAQSQAHQELSGSQQEQDAQKVAAKAAAAEVVGTGSGATNTTTALPADRNMSIREALEQAWDSQVE